MIKRRIENGITILSTGDLRMGRRNVNGYPGITKITNKNRISYCAYISVDGRKFYLCKSKDLEMVIKIKKVAEEKVKEGIFHEWFPTKPTQKDERFKEWWENQFKKYDL